MKKSIKFLVYLLLVTSILLTGCGNDDNKNNSSTKEENKSEINYTGTYKSDDNSFIEITKEDNNYKATISIYKLTTLDDCKVFSIQNDILNMNCTDASGNPIKFDFDYKTKILTVKESTWDLLNNKDTFEFNK